MWKNTTEAELNEKESKRIFSVFFFLKQDGLEKIPVERCMLDFLVCKEKLVL